MECENVFQSVSKGAPDFLKPPQRLALTPRLWQSDGSIALVLDSEVKFHDHLCYGLVNRWKVGRKTLASKGLNEGVHVVLVRG